MGSSSREEMDPRDSPHDTGLPNRSARALLIFSFGGCNWYYGERCFNGSLDCCLDMIVPVSGVVGVSEHRTYYSRGWFSDQIPGASEANGRELRSVKEITCRVRTLRKKAGGRCF